MNVNSISVASGASEVTTPLKVGLVGVGRWGSNLARNFNALGSLVALCDTNDAVRQRLITDYPGVSVHASLDSLLDTDEIEAVAVATRARDHAEVAKRVLKRGMQVYVEKPLATSLAAARSLASLATSTGLKIFVGHLLHYHPGFRRLQELVREGALGILEAANATRIGSGSAHTGEDVLWEYTPHDISMLLALADSPFAGARCHAVWEASGRMRQLSAKLEFESGFQAQVVSADRSPRKEQRLTVYGDRSVAVFDDTLGWEEKLVLYGADGEGPPQLVPLQPAEPLALECAAFLRSVSLNEACPTDSAEALRVMEVLDACQHSVGSAR